jgi:hypothetical protein
MNGERMELSSSELISLSVLVESRIEEIEGKLRDGFWDGEIRGMLKSDLRELEAINRKLGY